MKRFVKSDQSALALTRSEKDIVESLCDEVYDNYFDENMNIYKLADIVWEHIEAFSDDDASYISVDKKPAVIRYAAQYLNNLM